MTLKQPLLLLALPALLLCPLRAADFMTPGAAPDSHYDGHFPMPYKAPDPAEITALLKRVLAHSDLPEQWTVTDRKTKQAITDFSTPDPDASAVPGAYPTGVILSGALAVSEATGDPFFSDFVAHHLQFVSDKLPYFEAIAKAKGSTKGNPFHSFLAPDSLDACGAWGAAMIRAHDDRIGPDLRPVVDRYADYIEHSQFRLEDGTLARHDPQPDSLWADDMYMSIPFLSAMAKLSGDPRYYDDGARQVIQISQRLFIWNKGLFAHGWSAGNAEYNPQFHWGRANGWCLLAMCYLLDNLPADHPQREQILKILRTQIQALSPLQSGDGLWHQLLDKPDSFEETSCTAMFVYGIAHAINQGWVSAASYATVAQDGWNGLTMQVGPDGSMNHVCVGTNFATDAAFYYHRPEKDDVHGYGPLLMAGAEMIKFANNPHLKYTAGSGVYIYHWVP